MTRGQRNFLNEGLNDVYFSPNITWVIELRTMRWEGHVARLEGKTFRRKTVLGILVDTGYRWGGFWFGGCGQE